MLEIKLIPVKIMGKPKFAAVLGYSIQAEPDANMGVWCGSDGLNDVFMICHSNEQAHTWIRMLNSDIEGEFEMPVSSNIIQYLQDGEYSTTRMRCITKQLSSELETSVNGFIQGKNIISISYTQGNISGYSSFTAYIHYKS